MEPYGRVGLIEYESMNLEVMETQFSPHQLQILETVGGLFLFDFFFQYYSYKWFLIGLIIFSWSKTKKIISMWPVQ